MLQSLKDFVIASGAERWARPLWMTLTRTTVDPYDLQTFAVMERVLQSDSVCIDIGCHKGFILDSAIRRCGDGTFYAFEPLPNLAKLLRRKYSAHSRVRVYEYALSERTGEAVFFIDDEAPGRSGLYGPARNGRGREHTCVVKTARLDDLLPGIRPRFIKIDVEGAELDVLRGAYNVVATNKPFIVFEHGLSETRDVKPEPVYDFFAECDMKVALMSSFLTDGPALGKDRFCNEFYQHTNYNFIAYPARGR